MATGSKRGRKPSNSGRKTTTKSRKYSKRNQNPGVLDEIIIFITIGISLLLFLSICGLLGSFGQVVRGVLVGLYGMVSFLFPVGLCFAVLFWISNKGEKITRIKAITSFVLLWDLASLAQLWFSDNTVIDLSDYYTDTLSNGGFLGGIVTHFLVPNIGVVGTNVIFFVILIICIILLTDRSIFTSVKEGTKLINKDRQRNKEYRKELARVKDIEREERDMARWQKRNERYDAKAQKIDEKRAAALAERKRKAEERRAQMADKINFEAVNLKKAAGIAETNEDSKDIIEPEIDVEEQFNSNNYEPDLNNGADVNSIKNKANEPESLFYGSASTYSQTAYMPDTQDILAATNDALITNASANGLLSATKLSRENYGGDVIEITEQYNPDEEFVNYLNTKFNTNHKINVTDNNDSQKREAYEQDKFVDDTETFAEDYSDVAEVIDNSRNNIHKNYSRVESISDDIDKYLEDEEDSFDFESDNNVNDNYETDIPINVCGSDLASENAKPAPVSQIKSTGKTVKVKKNSRYKLPPVTLLDEVKNQTANDNALIELKEMGAELKETLHQFGLDVSIIGSSRGPAVTRYEIQMPTGVSVKKITNLSDDIMMSLGAKDIRIEAPIPGKKAVGIELPNRESTMVHFRELIDSKAFKASESKVSFAVGKDLSGDIVTFDIAKMPHVLIAGATGSGKSVCINTLIMSILYKAKPDEVKLIMIDPKMVELSIYDGIPHLLIPVVTDARKASAALSWAVNEMTLRYERFKSVGVRDMKGYNSKISTDPQYFDSDEHKYMPQIVIVVDELADLMMVAAKEVEESICRIAQLARAAGIYLVLATQRPSVDVVTGLIKANMPSRVAFSVTSVVDSRTILDGAGAEKLLGNGDMLFYPRGYNKPSRVQGAFVSDDEVQRVVDYITGQSDGDNYDESAINMINAGGISSAGGSAGLVDPAGEFDDLFVVAGHAVIENDKASIGMLQRKFKIGFNRAARIMDQLSDEGVVGPEEGTKPRRILMTMEQFNIMIEEKNH